MNNFTDEQLRFLADLIINTETLGEQYEIGIGTLWLLDTELNRREEVAGLDFECDSCTL